MSSTPPHNHWEEETPTAKREIPAELREESGPKTHATTKVDRAAIDALLAKTKDKAQQAPTPEPASVQHNTLPAGPPDFDER